ncbi:MAG: mechanosensitive ion channel [Desulfovibrio sp.]|nr:mechanosensitive ion channel [Desulfovibrio sp.]MBI4957938.1 mechanosensitive ion channel [Desulfovibrio sp.]
MLRLAIMFTLFLVFTGPVLSFGQDGRGWEEVLRGINRDIDRHNAEVEDIRRELPGLIAEAQDSLARIDNQLTQVIILQGVSGYTPWALRTLKGHRISLERNLAASAQKLHIAKEHLNRIKEENSTVREIRRKGPSNNYNNATVAALEAPAAKLEAMKTEVDLLKADIDNTLAQFDSLQNVLNEFGKDFNKEYIASLKEHFFSRTPSAITQSGLMYLKSRYADWQADFPRFITPVLAWTHWGDLALYGVPIWLGLWLVGLWGVSKAGVGCDRRVRLGWFLLSFGLVIWLVTMELPFTASHALNLGVVALGALGATILVQHHLPPGDLLFFLGLYAAGTVAQILLFPSEMLCLVIPLGLSFAIWNRWKRQRKGDAAGLALLGLAALCGFGSQSLVALQAWFLFKLSVGSARSVRATLAGWGEVWLKYVHPLVVTLLGVAYLSWVLLFMGGPGFMDYVFTLELALGPVKLSLDALAAMAVLFFAARMVLAWLEAFLERASVSGKQMDPALSHTLSTLASYTTWLAFLLAMLHILGLPLTGLTWIASGLSVGVGFGLKDIINNFVSGLIILFGGSIKKGDVVQTGKILGEVTNVSVRNTTVRTLDNSMVIIPNSSFLKGEIINWSYQDKRIRLTIPVSVVPGTKIKKVRKILLETAKAQDRVLTDPAPSVMLRQFGKLGLEFELYVWIEDFRDKYRVESDLATAIDQELQENKITVAFQTAKVKYKPKGSEQAQLEAAREVLREKRRTVFALVRPLRRVHMRAKWGMPAHVPQSGDS